MKKSSVSKIALIICYAFILFEGVIFYPKWKNKFEEAEISWDVSGYYMYLPATFIYGDLKHCAFKDKILATYKPTPDFQQAMLDSSGNYVMKYASGQAIMLSPFFFLAHTFCKVTGSYPADGFSFPYQLCIGLGALFYSLLGLWFLRKILLLYFTDVAVAITLLTIAIATNYLDYAAINGAMTHNTLFTLYCVLLLLTISFYNKPSLVKAVLIGGLCGLATITRPSEIIAILIPLLFGIFTMDELKERYTFFSKNIKYIIASGIAFALLVSVQLLYWKSVSGNWLVYSYENATFDWFEPHFGDAILSYKSGWLVYTPVMIFALAGFIFLFLKHKKLFLGVSIFVLLFMYINFAWSEWWYGGGLGQRCMVQCYALLAFPMAAVFEGISSKKIFMVITVPILVVFGYYNLWLTYQAHKGGLYHPAEMTKEYFWATLGKSKVDERTVELLDGGEIFPGRPANPNNIYSNDFENDTTINSHTDNTISGKSIYIDKDHQFSKTYSFTLPEHLPSWIRISADFRLTQKEWEVWKMPQVVVKLYEKDWLVKTANIRVNRMLPADNSTRNVSMDIKLPETLMSRGDIYFWDAASDKKVIIDNLKVIGFDN